MSIQSELTLLQNTKNDIRSAIMEKGVLVASNDPFAIYPTRIGQITTTPGDKDTLFRSLIERSATSLVIPNGTEKVRSHGFNGYQTLLSVTIPEGLVSIGKQAFQGCGLTVLELPSTITSIGDYAFNNCSSLTSITCLSTVPPALEDYGHSFDSTNDCPIYVPAASVTAYQTAWPQYASRIQEMASTRKGRVHYKDGTTADIPLNGSSTLYATELESLIVDGNPIVGLEVSNQCTIINSGSGSNYGFWYWAPELSWVRASSTVTGLASYVFESCQYITSLDDIQLPGVTNYPSYTFQSCLGLTDANIPEGVETVGNRCFDSCQTLSSIHIPSTLTEFNDYIGKQYSDPYAPLTSITVDPNNTTFSSVGNCLIQLYNGVYRLVLGCSTSVIPTDLSNLYIMANAFANNVQGNSRDYTVPTNVVSIGQYAFGNANSVTMLSSTPCALGSSALGYNFPIYVPSGSLETYLADSSWAAYEDRLFEIGVAKWTEQSYTCEVDATDTRTGMVTVVEKDTNPTSNTYNQTRTRTYEDLERCNPVSGFTKITSLDEATSGKYLIVKTTVNKALNASLIKDTTSGTTGINATNNMIDVTIGNNTITADATIMNAAADYDADNKTLSWTDSDTGTTYYLYWQGGSGANFAYNGNTQPSMQYPMEAKYYQQFGSFSFANSTKLLAYHTTGPRIRFYVPNNTNRYEADMALFKLN